MAEASAKNPPMPAAPSLVIEEYDSETAALMRSCLCPLIDKANSWQELIQGLTKRDYGLAIRAGRLVVIRCASGEQICTMRYLGTSLRDLSARWGRPMIAARRDQTAAGEFRI